MKKVISQLMFQGMWQNSLDSMFLIKVVQDEFYIEDINPTLQHTIGSESGTLNGLPVRDLLPDPDAVIERYRECLQLQETIYYEEEGLTPAGAINYWYTMLVPLHHDGCDYLLGSSRDINDLKYAELRAERARSEAEASNAAKTLFLTNMSHELRTPLNGITGTASLLRRDATNQDVSEQLDLIINSADAMNRLVEDILDLSKIVNNRLRITPAPTALKTTVEDVVALFREAANLKRLNYQYAFSDGFPRQLIADETRVRQILLNLMSNAIKFTEQGSIKLTVDFVPDQAPSSPLSGVLRITVKDTGVGIPEDKLTKVGTPFYQVDPERNRNHPGSGIGLSVCYSLTHLMSGSFKIASTAGTGTAVTVELPLNAAEPSAQDAAPEKAQLPEGFHVLVAEDNLTNQMILKRMLSFTGARVTLADNGEEAVALGQAQPFDLILMDLQMPLLDGISASHALRAAGISVPIVAVTASVSEPERLACERAEMTDFMAKPITLAAVESLLVRLYPAAAEVSLETP